MPYTPPAQSPGASPTLSRSSSYSSADGHLPSAPHSTKGPLKSNNPPRSSSYLHRHRRSASTSAVQSPIASTPPYATFKHSNGIPSPPKGRSIHQSPPPVDDGRSMIPAQAVLSPPDSSQNSSDEDDGSPDGKGKRGRDLGLLEDQLVEAIKAIPQRRQPSPERKPPVIAVLENTPANDRRFSHHRSSSESMMFEQPLNSDGSSSVSDYEDDGYRIAPPMIRKKSGELVKSSLKSPSRSRPVSMPSTPTFSKNVHFDSHIEHVRHFLHSERPSAVSAGSSPVDNFDGDSEFPFGTEEDEEPVVEWDIITPNLPARMEERKHLAVRLEKLVLSTDKNNLVGTVACENLAFSKSVVVRFTFDYWQTTSEVVAEYSNDVRRKQRDDGADRFVFKIKLNEQANLEKKTLFFCIRYNVQGQELWDNNGGLNFQVEFRKKVLNQRKGSRGGALPRSHHRVSPSAARPRSMPTFSELDLFAEGLLPKEMQQGVSLPQRKSKGTTKVNKDNLTTPARRANPSSNAFGNRYDFGASLNAAIKAATTKIGPEKSGLVRPANAAVPRTAQAENPYFKQVAAMKQESPASTTPLDSPSVAGAGAPEVFKPANLIHNGNGKPSIESPSYRELLDNFCFFGSAKISPTIKPKQAPAAKPAAKTEDAPSYTLSVRSQSPQLRAGSPPAALSFSQQKAAGNASPIQSNFAGFRHGRRQSGALRFENTSTPTAIY